MSFSHAAVNRNPPSLSTISHNSPNKLGLPLISAECLENKIHSCHTRHSFFFFNTQSSLPDACSLWFHCKESQHKERITSMYTFSHGNATGNDSSSTMSLIILKGSYCFLCFRQDFHCRMHRNGAYRFRVCLGTVPRSQSAS